MIWSGNHSHNEAKPVIRKLDRFQIIPLAVAALILTSPISSRAQMKARVAWTSFASNMSGTWVAQEEGFFKKNGLEVELVHIPSTSRAIQVMLAGELQYSYMDGRTSVTAALKGGDVVILAGVANRLVFSFMSRPEIKSFGDLKGKKIGITRLGSSTHSVTLWVMNKFGIKPEEYQLLQLVDVPNILTAIMAGQIDAGALSPPTNFRARKAGLTELMDLTKDGPEYVSVAIGSTRSFIKANEEMTRRFVRGYSEGVQFLKANKAAGIRAIQKYARIKDPDILAATYGEARAYIETIPYVSRKGLETIIGELVPNEPKARTAKPDDFLDTRFVAQLEKDGFYKALATK